MGGEKNIAFIDYNPAILEQYQPFIDRWKQTYGVS